MTHWTVPLAALALLLLLACEEGKSSPVHADAAVFVEAAAPAAPTSSATALEVEAGPASCDLGPEERAELEKCLWGLVSYRVGIRGSFPIRVRLSVESGKARASSQVDFEAWREAPEGSCLVTLARRLAGDGGGSLSCAYSATGPAPKWTVKVDRLPDAGQ